MAIVPTGLARVSNLLRSNVTSQSITTVQQQLLDIQNELSTGRHLSAPSVDPGAASIAQQLRKTLETNQAYAVNLKSANSKLSEVDSTLGDLTDLLQQAQNIASQNVGSDVTPDGRIAAAAVIDSIYSQALSIANKQSGGAYVFGGDRSTTAPYVDTAGGVQFVGGDNQLQNAVGDRLNSYFTIDGTAVFGAISSQVQGTSNLTPTVTSNTRIADLRGASGNGVKLSSIVVGNGTTSATIDLSGANNLGDVVNLINQAGVSGVTASIASNGHSLQLAATGTETISVVDVANGTSAVDLGILQTTPAAAGVTVLGTNVNASVSPLTTLALLRDGAGIDTTNGFTITNGGTSANIDLTGAVTVEDLLNKINSSNTGARAEINAAGTGINVLNATQGTDLRISENGGTTASDLGLRSLTPSTALADLNGGKGVRFAAGNDITITRTDGTTLGVDLDGSVTIQDVINKINTADGGNGTTASFSSTGNGIVITDTAGGSVSPLALSPANFSNAAADLGLLAAPVGTTLTGADTNPIQSNGVFSNLAKLRAGLLSSDTAKITEAAEGLTADQGRVVVVRGTTGAKVQELTSRANRMEDQNVATTSLLSNLEDTNYTEAISKFQTLQTQLQAAMQAGAAQMKLSLLDFLG